MRHDHLKKELELLLILTQNRQYTPDEICQEMGISRRSLYYYLEFFREAGFTVDKAGRYYYISRESEFFSLLFDRLQLNGEEVSFIRKLIEGQEIKTIKMIKLLKKLDGFYDFRQLDSADVQKHVSRTYTRLNFAIKNHRMVRIVNYSSNNSRSVSDRLVEPFLFLNNDNDVRCYELASGKNKTFHLSRMESVEVLNDEWHYENKHRKIFHDMFMFSGEEHYKVELILGQMAHNLMLEEYPMSAPCMVKREDGRWTFRTEICSYLGIGRFILGLYDDVEVVSDKGLRDYINEKIASWARRIKETE